MSNALGEVLQEIGEEYKEEILDESEFILEVDIGKQAEKLGYSDIKEKYHDVEAIVPLRQSVKGLKVRIDGRTFVNYAQLESGIAVPGYVAEEAGLPYKTYKPHDSLIRNFG
jgi:hypothetical protein